MPHPVAIAGRKLFAPLRHGRHEFRDLAFVVTLIAMVAAFVLTIR
jgi:hypothetical protein